MDRNVQPPVKLTPEMIEAFAGVYLSNRYDSPQPTPDCHREWWEYYCSDALQGAIAAPRNHAKSTALTQDFVLANACFRIEPYIIVLGSSEEMAIEHLGDIALELRENEALIRDFRIKNFVQDTKTDIIVECTDGYQFRILARGAEQKIRGRKWRGRRPGLIVGDDLEDDEMVLNKDWRRKFSRWFFRAVKQVLRDGGKMRVHGTILHADSLLARLIKIWNGKLYKAHRSFDEFTEILWPEKFPAARLRAIRDEFVKLGDSGGYSSEYLNDPFDSDIQYIRREDILGMSEEDREKPKVICAASDFAISTLDSANRTAIAVGGKDLANIVHQVDQRVGRWNSLEIIEEHFAVQQRWDPEIFFVEDGQIWKALWPMFKSEMALRDIWINFQPITPVRDKATRGRAFQRRTRAGGFKADKDAGWYEAWEEEVLRFTGQGEAILDDQFDSSALLCRGFEDIQVDKGDFEGEEEEEFLRVQRDIHSGRSARTGY